MSAPDIVSDFVRAFVGYGRWVLAEARDVSLHSYVWLLFLVTLVVMTLEYVRPWRAQTRSPRETTRGLAYVLLNFFGFGLLGYAALSDVAAARTASLLYALGLPRSGLIESLALPLAVEVLLYLVVRDFMEYFIHRLLHRVPWLWRFHALHHSATSMHVLTHLRFHPVETVVYRTLEFIPMMMLGFSPRDFFAAHAIALVVGHLNHANLFIPMGPLKYVLNSAAMHRLHHAKVVPEPFAHKARGANFGLTFSVWDYIFGTAWDPDIDRKAVALGFPGVEHYPVGLGPEFAAPFRGAPGEDSAP